METTKCKIHAELRRENNGNPQQELIQLGKHAENMSATCMLTACFSHVFRTLCACFPRDFADQQTNLPQQLRIKRVYVAWVRLCLSVGACGSRTHANHLPRALAPVNQTQRRTGAICLGTSKLNLNLNISW